MDISTMKNTIFEAIEFAKKAHSGQYRKGTKFPYMVHPLNVGAILIDHQASDEIVIAGVLHDTVEDTDVSLEEIREQFGDKVARLVEGASEPDKSLSWEERKQHTIDYLKTAPADQLLVALADKLDNVTAIRRDYEKHGDSLWSRFLRPKEKQAWYYQSLVDVFSSRVDDQPVSTIFALFRDEVLKVFGSKGN